MNDEQLLRYSRHILLPEIDVSGQEKISQAHALIVGAGGLGSPVALYLASAGVGEITIVDDDEVDLTNLQRQIIHSTERVGQSKVSSAAQSMAAINPHVTVNALHQRLDAVALAKLLPTVSIVLDCCDNFATRHAVNAACVAHRVPLVSGAAIRFDGQVSVYDPRVATSPCYHCLFPAADAPDEVRCAVMGVFAPITGVVGCIQAMEALKLIMGLGEPLIGRLLMVDALGGEFREIRFPRDPHCLVCKKENPHAP
jgi:molybdopterin-synthase adenylyltransferase